MEFKNAISLLFSNVGYVFKILMYLVVVIAIVVGLGFAIIYPIWNVVVDTTGIGAHMAVIKESAEAVWNGSHNLRYEAKTIIPEVIRCLDCVCDNAGAAAGLAIGATFLYAVFSFLMGICSYTVGDVVNKLMTSNLRFGFASALVLNMKKSVKFSAAKLLVSLPVDIAIVVFFAGISLLLYLALDVFSLLFILIIAVLLCTGRELLFAGWLPRYLYHEYERPLACLSRSFPAVRANFGELLKSYATLFTLLYLSVSLLMIPTGGIVLLLLPSVVYFMVRAVELIGYFKTKGFSFYTDGSTVVNTVDFGLRSSNQLNDDGFDGEVGGDRSENEN